MDALSVLLSDISHSGGAGLYIRMDGAIPASLRKPLIDRFNTDPTLCVALLSIRAMGTGEPLP